MFTTANFPGASSTDLTNARSLYALVTGRVSAITGSAYLDGGTGKYVYLGDAYQKAHEREMGFFVQDSWKIRPDLTLTYGIRYELQMPFIMDNAFFSRPLNFCNTYGVSGCASDGVSANLFAPGSTSGTGTQFRAFSNGEASYTAPKNNWAPSAGVAWRPHLAGGWMEKLFSADPVLRGGYRLVNRPGRHLPRTGWSGARTCSRHRRHPDIRYLRGRTPATIPERDRRSPVSPGRIEYPQFCRGRGSPSLRPRRPPAR